MKKAIIIIMFLACVPLYSQDWGKPGAEHDIVWLAGHLEVGWDPFVQQWDWSGFGPHDEYSDVFYTDFGLTAHATKYFFIGGNVRTFTIFNEDSKVSAIPNFIPFLVDYSFFAGIRLYGFEIGFRHLCSHPVNGSGGYQEPILENNRAYEEIYLRFEF
jgi:hypothetical protein